jgi:hypothetical protein
VEDGFSQPAVADTIRFMKHSVALEVLAAIVLFVGLYEAAYYATVGKELELHEVELGSDDSGRKMVPTYRFLGDLGEPIFSIAHALDRQLRPDFWTVPANLEVTIE